MQFFGAFHQTKAYAKLVVEGVGVIANNIEPAAFCGTLWSKCADDYMTTRLDGATNLPNILSTVFSCSKKMKHRTVMPHIVGAAFELCIGDIGDEPMDLFCRQPQPLNGHVDSGLRNIEDSDLLIAPCKEGHPTRVDSPPPTSIDGCRKSGSRALYKSGEVSKCGQCQLTASGAPLQLRRRFSQWVFLSIFTYLLQLRRISKNGAFNVPTQENVRRCPDATNSFQELVRPVPASAVERIATNSRRLPASDPPCHRYGLAEVHSLEAWADQRTCSEEIDARRASSPRKTTSDSSSRMRFHRGSESVGKSLNIT